MKKTLSMLIISAATISAAQAAVTLVSGFSHFGQGDPAVSDLGSKSISLSLANAIRNDDGTFTTDPANNTKTMLDVSSLGLSGAAGGSGYTVNINFQKATDLNNQDSLFCASIGEANSNSLIGRYENGDKIGIANNGSSTGRPGSGLSGTAIDFNNPFSLTLSVQAEGAYTLFITQNGFAQALSWPSQKQSGTLNTLYLGSWATLPGYQSAATISGISFWEGAATQDDLAAIINVPEPATASLGLVGLGALFLHRRRK